MTAVAKTGAFFPFAADRIVKEYLSAEQYQKSCDQIWSTDHRAPVQGTQGASGPGAVVYAKADHFRSLFQQLRKQRGRIVLVTAESDLAITGEIAGLRPAQVADWFSTNAATAAVHSLPLGLANSYCQVTVKAPLLASCLEPVEERPAWLYVNFRRESNPSVRGPLLDHFRMQGGDWVTVREGDAGLEKFVKEMAAHRFMLCPPGNGIDTHRMWEALYCKTIPVVLRHPALAAYEDLPILFVDDFRGISRAFLEESYEKMRTADWNYEKLFLPWWREQIEAAARKLRRASNSRLPFLRYLRRRIGL